MQKLNQKYINTIVKKALDEDLKPSGDITTNLISFKNKKNTAKIIAKHNGIIACLNFCKTAFKLIGKETKFISKVNYRGSKRIKYQVVISARIDPKCVLKCEEKWRK